MAASGTTALTECLADLPDPRVERTRLHALTDILVIAICAVLCGAEGWDDMVEFSQAKQEWLKERLSLENGLPCADTYRRVFARLDPDAFGERFLRWAQSVQGQTRGQASRHKGQVIAVDGKALRHSFDTASGQQSIHMVSAWA